VFSDTIGEGNNKYERRPMTIWVKRLIIANVAMFLLSMAVPSLFPELMLVPRFALSRPWTFVTYMFLHAGPGHLLFNMLGLFFFGPRLEQRLGGRNFIWLYFLSGLVGAILSFIFTPFAAIVGASGAVFGVFLGFAYYWPRERIMIWPIFFPVEARILVGVLTVLSLFSGFGRAGTGVAHFTHLGGFAGGFLYLKWLEWRSPADLFRKRARAPAAHKEDLQRWENIQRESMHEVNRVELDRVMGKITASGVRSLNSDERAFLNRFSAR
jgi:membrane associated rhomboid family serine protease